MVCLKAWNKIPLCVCESMPLSAYDVTGHEQKDLVRISRGLDIYFNFFCQVKCVIYSSYEQSGPSRCAAYRSLLSCTENTEKANTHWRTLRREHVTLQINQMNFFMTCWWHQKKINERKSAYTFFFFGILQNSLNPLRVLFPWQQGLGLCLRVYVCPARLVAFFWCSQAPSCARGFRGQQHRLKHSVVGFFSASLHCQSVRNHTRHTYTLYNTWFTHVDTHDTCNCCKQLARLGNVPAYFLGFTLRFLFFPSLINAAAAAASFCPASCLHAAASNLKAEQHLSHPVSYHSLLSIASLAFSLSSSFSDLNLFFSVISPYMDMYPSMCFIDLSADLSLSLSPSPWNFSHFLPTPSLVFTRHILSPPMHLHVLLHLNPPPPTTACLAYCHLSPVSPVDDNICLTVDKSVIRHGSKCRKAL